MRRLKVIKPKGRLPDNTLMTSMVITPGAAAVRVIGERRELLELMSRASVHAEVTAAHRTGGKKRWEPEREKLNARDRRIHDAHHVDGLTPKAIAAAMAISGHGQISASQVRRILAKPRP